MKGSFFPKSDFGADILSPAPQAGQEVCLVVACNHWKLVAKACPFQSGRCCLTQRSQSPRVSNKSVRVR